jgi:2-polyprenylphenol 6-hydroxylase
MSNETSHIVIIGGGPTGLAAAVALASCDAKLHITVVERAPAIASEPLTGPMDSRVYSISPSTQSALAQWGAWAEITRSINGRSRVCPVQAIEVCSPQVLRFDKPRSSEHAAWIVEHRAIEAALAFQCQRYASIRFVNGVHLQRAERKGADKRVTVQLSDGQVLHAGLLIGADGVESVVRTQFAFDIARKPYGQVALVANWRSSVPHQRIARQWFDAPGTLALLPLPDDNEVSMVWSRALPCGDSANLADAVRVASRGLLGELSATTKINEIPLTFASVDEPIVPMVALIGDAAHRIHPLAGQGVNLGLLDAQALAGAILKRSAFESPGDWTVLRRFVRERAAQVLAMQIATDSLGRFLSPDSDNSAALAPMQALANFGLRTVSRTPPLRRWFSDRAS